MKILKYHLHFQPPGGITKVRKERKLKIILRTANRRAKLMKNLASWVKVSNACLVHLTLMLQAQFANNLFKLFRKSDLSNSVYIVITLPAN